MRPAPLHPFGAPRPVSVRRAMLNLADKLIFGLAALVALVSVGLIVRMLHAGPPQREILLVCTPSEPQPPALVRPAALDMTTPLVCKGIVK
jgi:hypothetical protein